MVETTDKSKVSQVDFKGRSEFLCFIESYFFQAEDDIRDTSVIGVQTCALPIWQCQGGGRRPRVPVLADAAGAVGVQVDADRKSGVEGKRVDLGGRRIIKKK